MAIATLDQLREHLRLAIKVELSTVPAYLYAMYSIRDQESEAALLIRSVVAEEMLHAALAANLLLAIGGNPDFRSPDVVPVYPSDLPHHRPPLTLNLRPCSKQQVDELFLVIEQPETHHEIPDDDIYDSLGQFYHAIERGLAAVATSSDLFANPQLERQMSTHSYYSPVKFDAEESGGLAAIDNIEAANEAIHVIIHQGEGVSDEKWADPGHQELTHYFKFLRISHGEAPIGPTAHMPDNPRVDDYPEEARAMANLFNAVYRYVYFVMDDIFQPTADRDALVSTLYMLMSDVLSPIGHRLTAIPLGDGVAAPTFELYDFGLEDPVTELNRLAAQVCARAPELDPAAKVLATL